MVVVKLLETLVLVRMRCPSFSVTAHFLISQTIQSPHPEPARNSRRQCQQLKSQKNRMSLDELRWVRVDV